MITPTRQQELDDITQKAFANNSSLKRALEVFQMGQTQYTRALQGMNSVKIIVTNSTNFSDTDVSNDTGKGNAILV